MQPGIHGVAAWVVEHDHVERPDVARREGLGVLGAAARGELVGRVRVERAVAHYAPADEQLVAGDARGAHPTCEASLVLRERRGEEVAEARLERAQRELLRRRIVVDLQPERRKREDQPVRKLRARSVRAGGDCAGGDRRRRQRPGDSRRRQAEAQAHGVAPVKRDALWLQRAGEQPAGGEQHALFASDAGSDELGG